MLQVRSSRTPSSPIITAVVSRLSLARELALILRGVRVSVPRSVVGERLRVSPWCVLLALHLSAAAPEVTLPSVVSLAATAGASLSLLVDRWWTLTIVACLVGQLHQLVSLDHHHVLAFGRRRPLCCDEGCRRERMPGQLSVVAVAPVVIVVRALP